MKLLELTTQTEGPTVRLALTGELDIAGAPRVEQELERIERETPATLVLDLRELAFMDSSGLRLVALAERRMVAAGRSLALIKGRDAVQRVFAITRMEDHLTFLDGPEALDDEAAA
jgi:anti-anti-sigma factor